MGVTFVHTHRFFFVYMWGCCWVKVCDADEISQKQQ